METSVRQADREAIEDAARLLVSGEVVAFPTETVYGLGADARSATAVARIYAAKGRPSDNPLIVHVADMEQAEQVAQWTDPLARRLAARFWPGPLTLVLPVLPGAVSDLVTAGLDTVGLRMPSHSVALQLIAASGVPVAAPSANRSGRPSPTQASHVEQDLDGRIPLILDGGSCGMGLESTVVRVVDGQMHLLRPGGITTGQLQEAAGPDYRLVVADGEELHQAEAAPRSPGVKYTHYAPKGELVLVDGPRVAVQQWIGAETAQASAAGWRVGVLAFEDSASFYKADLVVSCGSRQHPEQAAQRLYEALRQFDEQHIDKIWAETCPDEGLGMAVMNRLRKAAGHRVLRMSAAPPRPQ